MGKRGVVAAALVAAVSLVVVAPSSLGDTSRFKAQGCESNPHWDPGTRRIGTGDKAVWKNPTDCDHTVTAYAGDWNKNTGLGPGDRTSKTFNETGRFKFRCMSVGHSAIEDGKCIGMCGKVVVSQ